MLYGKQRIGQYYYYFDPVRGTMCTGWITINKKLYYFYKDGKMAVNTVVDHMTVGPDGVAIDNIVFKINDIMKYEGAPYRYGGTTPKGWDCSGFTQWALKYMGASIPRTAAQQGAAGLYIPKNNRSAWKPGDILCYKNGGRVSHVALYLGNGRQIARNVVSYISNILYKFRKGHKNNETNCRLGNYKIFNCGCDKYTSRNSSNVCGI